MLAARLVGRREFSYAALVKSEFGIELTKGSQKANWARRPLTPTMAEYAQNDTRYLLTIADRLEGTLHQLGRWPWFEQSCARALAQAAVERERDAEDAWRINGSGVLRGRAAATLRELWHWREGEARIVDRPTFHILRNEDLLNAARAFTAGEKPNFEHLRGSRRTRFYEAADRAAALPESGWPVFVKRYQNRWTAEEEKRADALKKERDRVAAELDLESSIIAPRATLEAIAARPQAAAELLMPWQRELLGISADAGVTASAVPAGRPKVRMPLRGTPNFSGETQSVRKAQQKIGTGSESHPYLGTNACGGSPHCRDGKFQIRRNPAARRGFALPESKFHHP